MKVIDLLENDFQKACSQLAENVLNVYMPDMVIGVLTGGGVVGRNMMKKFEERDNSTKYLEYKVQRALTQKKEGIGLRNLLTKIPRFVTRKLILIEVLLLEYRSLFLKPSRFVSDELKKELTKEFKFVSEDFKILIVDDCIDTGATIEALVSSIKEINPNIEIRVAVITITHKKPLVSADFQLYSRTICRFPWSMEIQQV